MPWEKGQSGNPKGSTHEQQVRARLAKAFHSKMLADFEKHGIAAIEKARNKDPVGYINVIARLMPKEHRLHVQHDYYVLLQQAMEQVQSAEIGADGRKKLEHLAVNAVEQSIIQGELVEEERDD